VGWLQSLLQIIGFAFPLFQQLAFLELYSFGLAVHSCLERYALPMALYFVASSYSRGTSSLVSTLSFSLGSNQDPILPTLIRGYTLLNGNVQIPFAEKLVLLAAKGVKL